ncbi:MAG: Hsp70 family protein, partial [Candidatus Thiodiazotropha sp. (ex Lucinoma kastoroae)]|nr:Hsp70 family protein [Candidatus Thiodiazotropha sp. (ex Lucinoma kastoroae)]
HATRKSMDELGEDKLEAGEKEAIDSAIKDLEEVLKGDDKEAIEEKTKTLAEASGKMAERLYAQNSADAGAAAPGAEQESAPGQADDDVVDAEFEEVKDNKN